MTLIDLESLVTVQGGFSPTLHGTVTIEYWAGSRRSHEIDGAEVRFSVPIVITLTGQPVVVDLEPTRGLRCVHWTFEGDDQRDLVRDTEIPDVDRITFGELQEVDPFTYEPSDQGRAAWEAAIAEVQGVLAETRDIATGVETTALEVENNAGAAAESEHQAGEHAGAAEGSRAAALGHANAAGISAGAAADAEGRASGFAETAEGSSSAAAASAGLASGSASQASGFAGAASGSAGSAAGSASAASTFAGAAGGSASAAATSEGQAAASASASQGSASAAAGSAGQAGQALADTRAARDETIVAVTTAPSWTGAVTLTQAQSRSKFLRATLTGNVTLTLAAGVAGVAYSCTLRLAQDATGGRTLVLVNVATSYAVAIALTTTAAAVDIIRLEWDGTSWTAFLGAAQIGIPAGWVV